MPEDEPIPPPVAHVPAPPPVQSNTDYSQPPAPGQYQTYQQGPSDALGNLVPTKNPKALAAYYCGIFALVPCVTTFVLGPLAIIYGRQGLKAIEEAPGLPGKAHAIVGIVLGSVMLLLMTIAVGIVVVAGLNS